MDNSKIISFIKTSSEIHNNKYNYDKIIFTKGSPLVIITCPTHGDFNQSRYSHLKGSGCKLCSIDSNTNKLKDTVKDFILKANKVHNNLYDYSKTVYKSSKEHVIIVCSTHGEFLQKPNNHLSGYGCNLCGIEKSTEKQTLTLEEFIERSNKTHSNRYDYSNTVYTNFKTKVSVVCKEHGEFNQKPYDHIQGKGCSKCSQIVSSEEIEVLKYIRSLKTSYELLPSHRPLWLNRKELDIYVPEISLAIEYNGSIFHHSSKNNSNGFIRNTSKDKNYHFNKWKDCFENKTTLLSIYDFYWKDPIKQDIYKSKIHHLLKLDNKVYARKCSIVSIPNNIAYAFYKENHLEGSGFNYRNSNSYGLYFNDVLYMCATVGEYYNQSSKEFKLKLQRICTLKYSTVVGGISKLSKYILKIHGTFEYQITLSSGGETLRHYKDFEIIPPRYFWVNSKNVSQYFHRNYCQKHKLQEHFNKPLKPEDTESSYMESLDYLKVYDNGLARLKIG